MSLTVAPSHGNGYPHPKAVLELLKPVTWFPPMWAFMCGAVSSGYSLNTQFWLVAAGVLLCGPLVCAMSQAVNDWFDRHVDAVNEPNRPIPSGRVPGRWGLYIGIIWTALSLVVAGVLGPTVFSATCLGVLLAWFYSAPPIRLKLNGWWGNAAVGACYEGLPWITGASVMAAGGLPNAEVFLIAGLYSAGAHGIMTLNDFKAIEGDTQLGVRTLPVQLGAKRAARLACWVMALAQVAVIGLLILWGAYGYALAVSAVLLVQLLLMKRLLTDPEKFAPWYNATGISLYVTGMLISAFALRGLFIAA
jgi:chlorophyll/bacteriochlorophyll a synthase